MTPEELESRAAEVLAAMAWLGFSFGGHTTDVVARCLSLYQRRDCPWCPLNPLGKRQPARTVPPKSRELVRQVMLHLQATGRAVPNRDPAGKLLWVTADLANLPKPQAPARRAARPGWSFAAGPRCPVAVEQADV